MYVGVAGKAIAAMDVRQRSGVATVALKQRRREESSRGSKLFQRPFKKKIIKMLTFVIHHRGDQTEGTVFF